MAAGPSTTTPTPSRSIGGSTPGLLDPTQPARLLRLAGSKLSFASFDPRTAFVGEMPDMRKLSLKDELYRPKRVVVETTPTGESFWRFVPSARKEVGVENEGTWPRVIEICGELVNCSRDQWDIYKLDPHYDCLVRAYPKLSVISPAKITQRPKAESSKPQSSKRRSRSPGRASPSPIDNKRQRKNVPCGASVFSVDSSDDEEAEVAYMMIDDDGVPRARSAGAGDRLKEFRAAKERNRQIRRENIIRASAKSNASPDEMDISPIVPPTDNTAKRKGPSASETNGTDGSATSKRHRTVSPSSVRHEMSEKTFRRTQKKKDRIAAQLNAWREEKHRAFMNDILADVPEQGPELNGAANHQEPPMNDAWDSESEDDYEDEAEAARLAAIEESRRKLAELEADRPLWEEEAKKRAARQHAEEEERRARAAERKRAEAKAAEEARRAEREKAEREEAQRRRQEETARKERERRQRQQRERWSYGQWTSQRALERYRSLADAFDSAKFSPEEPLTFEAVPWPVLHSPVTFTVEMVDWSAVESFFTAVRSHMRPQDYKIFIEASHRRFHPDRWRSRRILASIADEDERGCLEVAATTVSQATEDRCVAHDRRATSRPRSEGTSAIEPPLRSPMSDSAMRPWQRSTPTPAAVDDGVDRLPSLEAIEPSPRRTEHTVQLPEQPQLSWYKRTKRWLGRGHGASRARRAMVDFIWNISWGFVQIVIILTLLGVASHRESPTMAGENEWRACERPLGLWNCLWLGRVFLACGLSYWGWCRDRKASRDGDDLESGASSSSHGVSHAASAGGRPPRNAPIASRSTRSNAVDPPHTSLAPASNQDPTLPHSHLYARLTLFSSLMTLTWFLTAHILVYTSVNTCRHSSPHIWWLTFGILCIMYLMVLEVFLLGFLVFIIAPILFIFYNIILICLGRHPLQNPGTIHPEIGKLPKTTVDRIPLVIYIPPPPDEPAKEGAQVTVPKPIYGYPPKAASALPAPKRRFAFLKRVSRRKFKNGKANGKPEQTEGKTVDDTELPSWEANWEQGEYPFVRLEGNRAACAICLMDFEEPKRLGGAPDAETEQPAAEDKDEPVQEVPATEAPATEAANEELKLTDAGEGVQPLRLLECGHVFHKTCLDPWLMDVSGRCPICQRAVHLPEIPTKKKGRRSRNR
ncbi:hypothetical protein PLICRDRAFT_155823 [Plicaturopsis crispa FD-325 SS-3]|nr:hypothetical protein PLICRDRAFT_155823 [Plicaturopsis crispa FD-325 SS-3]